MLRSRYVPVITMLNEGLIKTRGFKKYKYVGDPVNVIKIFNEKRVDELAIYDISPDFSRAINFDLLAKIAREANMPLCYGGRVSSAEEASRLVKLGFEKVSVSRLFFKNISEVKRMSEMIGSQSVVVTLDVKDALLSGWTLFSDNGKNRQRISLEAALASAAEVGVGEVCIQNITRDGSRKGYDMKLVDFVMAHTSCPVTILGGCAGSADMATVNNKYGPIGIGASAEYVLTGKHDAVLITYHR